MQNLITISKTTLNGSEINSVNSREIHSQLEVKTKYADWIKRAIDKYGFEENQDFTVLKNGNGNNALIDYVCTFASSTGTHQRFTTKITGKGQIALAKKIVEAFSEESAA